jgi:hypothetical protein
MLPIYENCPDFASTISELRGRGFEVAALAPVSYHKGAVVEYDCVMLNNKMRLSPQSH